MSPVVSVRAILIHENRILLSMCESKETIWYVVPGGGVQRGETLEEAFARETYEECGVSLSFGEIRFIREFITARSPDSHLDEDIHQIDINVQTQIAEPLPELRPRNPDRFQVGLVWLSLMELRNINFYPSSLVNEFVAQSWPKFYYGACA